MLDKISQIYDSRKEQDAWFVVDLTNRPSRNICVILRAGTRKVTTPG